MSNTKTSVALGSPAYMAPEQMRSAKHVDKRADIWSLGAILYQLLSNRMPFEAESPPEMFARVLGDEPTPLQELVPSIDIGLADIVHKCLTKDRSQRYASVSQFAKALVPFGDQNAAQLADSVANVEKDHSEPEAAPSRASTTNPGHDFGPKALASTAQTIANKPNTITTRSGSAGPIVAEALALPEISSRDNKKFALIGGVIAALALVLVFTKMGGNEDSAKPNAAASHIDTAIPDPAETAPQPMVATDAAVPDAADPDATEPDAATVEPAVAKSNTDTQRKRQKPDRRKRPKPGIQKPDIPKPDTDKPKPDTDKPKKPSSSADPFGTMQ